MHFTNLRIFGLSILLFTIIVQPSQLYKDGIVAFGNQQASQYQRHRDKAHELRAKGLQERKDLQQEWKDICNEWVDICQYNQVPGSDRSKFERLVQESEHRRKAYQQLWKDDLSQKTPTWEAEAKSRGDAKDALMMNRLAQKVVRGVMPAQKWMTPEQRRKQQEEQERKDREEKDATLGKGIQSRRKGKKKSRRGRKKGR